MMMKGRTRHLLRLGVFCVATALSYGWLWQGKQAGPTGQTVASRKLSGTRGSPGDKAAESTLLATVHHLLRAGDVEGMKAVLRQVAERDPQEFFRLLLQMPYLNGLTDIQDIVKEAGSHLVWRDPAALALLGRIVPHEWSFTAWNAYVGEQVGKVPDGEILDVVLRAPNGWLHPLVQDAAEKRPREFMQTLAGRNCPQVWNQFFFFLPKARPELATELFKEVPAGVMGRGYSRNELSQSLVATTPTAQNLIATMDAMNDAPFSFPRGAYDLTLTAYQMATPEERSNILAAIAQQPSIDRSQMLDGVLVNPRHLTLPDLGTVMEIAPSVTQQQEALGIWLKMQPDLDPSGQGWLDRLPTEKLRAKALELKRRQ